MLWYGPSRLTDQALGVMREGPGAYILGFIGSLGGFVPAYVGGGFASLPGRLRDHLPAAEQNSRLRTMQCDWFYYCYAVDQLDAFQFECAAYHELGGPRGLLVNEAHPTPHLSPLALLGQSAISDIRRYQCGICYPAIPRGTS